MKSVNEIPDQNNEVVVTFLNLLLADEYVLYTKTRTAHWNVDGSNYFELHVFLEHQYSLLDVIIDDLAEQIRSLGYFALGSLKDFLSVAQMGEENHNYGNSAQILASLLHDHEAIISIIEHEIPPISDELKSRETAAFLAGILEKQKKSARQIKAFLSSPELNSDNHLRIVYNQSVEQQV
ncbi:MAG: ferritin-like domain-containing protein [Bacteroidota bacterium]|nr:ferritin-like domain-containing protein [Bacteroidota bacterium]